jgi:predicted LPLAT superfamily acyltransferase
LLVDRAQPGHPTVEAPFLGAPAMFPSAPWLIAAVLKVPITLAFGLYRGGNRYDLVFETFSDGLDIPRRERATAIPALIRGYAARLEHYVRSAPYNWFNFYDFWEPGDDSRSVDSRSDDSRSDAGHSRGTTAAAHGTLPARPAGLRDGAAARDRAGDA